MKTRRTRDRNALTVSGYVAVRMSADGHAWLDMSTWSYTRARAREVALSGDKAAGLAWAGANRVVGIALVDVVERGYSAAARAVRATG